MEGSSVVAARPAKRVYWTYILVFVFACTATAAYAQVASEYQVKAAYLYQFLNFVDWPESAFRDANDPFEICILGIDPFGSDLDRIIQNKQVRGRAIHVRRSSASARPTRCHIVFIAETERTRMQWILESVSGQSVLTVGELPAFEENGGMFRFVIERDSVRLRINAHSATQAGLRISSRLLSVATLVGQ